MTPLTAQLQGAIPGTAWELVTTTTGATRFVLVFLVALSLLSWAIIVAKLREMRAASEAGRRFVAEFEQQQSFADAAILARARDPNPFAHVVERAERFLAETTPALAATADRASRLSASQVEALRLVLDAEQDSERDRLGRFVPWLATIGSVSPLIGLLGTVLGIIDSFLGIARSGSGNIGAVAPGVAEALIATAAALAVAIPAVFAYNLFAGRLNRLEGELEGFGSELIALLVREGRI